MLPRLALTFALAAFVCPAALYAQPAQLPQPVQPENPDNDGAAPAHVAHVDGAVTLEREGRAETSPLNMPLLSGDRLRTAEGRVEVLFADGSTLHLDLRSTIDVQSDDLVRLTDGRLRLNILGPGADGRVSHRFPRGLGAHHAARRVPHRAAHWQDGGADEIAARGRRHPGRGRDLHGSGVDAGARRRAGVRQRRARAVVRVCLQLGDVGPVRSVVGSAA